MPVALKGPRMSDVPALSIVVPLYNEEDSVTALVEAVRVALPPDLRWELVLVDDGSVDGTVARATALANRDGRVRLVRLARNYGQTPAMQAGFDHARGAIVVSMDGDLQNDPADIPRLIAKIDEGFDLVAGFRESRQDRVFTRKLPSYVANRMIRWITGVSIRDNGCSLKAYRRELLGRVHLYSDMHRFIPAVAAATGGARITEIPVRHHARRFGRSKYGLSRVLKVLADLLTILMIRSFRERPLALFAGGAVGTGVLGLLFGAVVVVSQLGFSAEKANTVVLSSVALLWFSLAAYLLMLGLVGEVALRQEWRAASVSLAVVHERMLGGR